MTLGGVGAIKQGWFLLPFFTASVSLHLSCVSEIGGVCSAALKEFAT